MEKQTSKGVAKYGHTLDDCPDDKFDWRMMALEEITDLVQYQQKEIIRLEKIIADKAQEWKTLKQLPPSALEPWRV